MYASASGHRVPGRSRQRSRTQSDPGHPYVTPPYIIQRPAPARQTTEPVVVTAGTPYQRSPSRSSSIDRTGDTFVPSPGSLLSQYQIANSPPGETSPSTSVSPRSPSPQRSGHQRSSSRQGSIRTPQGHSGPLIKDVPQPPRTALNVPSAVTAAPHPNLASWGQGFSMPAPTPFQSASMQRQGSYHTVHQQQPAGVYQIATATHLSHHHSPGHHQPNPPHHTTHHRRPPSAASHRYASSFTQPMYGHGSSASLNASRTSLNGGVASQKNHLAMSPPPATHISHHPGTGLAHMPSVSPQRSRSQTRVPPPSTPETIATAPLAHKRKGTSSSPSPLPMPTASELRRSIQRPALPASYDGQTQTRYVNMLLALGDISPLFNILASFFTWILLAGFLLFPGTFASWKDVPAGSPQSDILDVVNHVSLYVIAWICTGVGASGMIWLWWRWHNNYIWITNRIFVPGCLNSVAGVISTLSSIYGAQAGVFGESEKSTIIVTGALSLICGTLVLVYEFWFLRNLKLEHDHIVGVEMAGKHGEGVLGEKRDGRS